MGTVKDHVAIAREGTLRKLADEIEAAIAELADREANLPGLFKAVAAAQSALLGIQVDMDGPVTDVERDALEALTLAQRDCFRSIDRIAALRLKLGVLTSEGERERRLRQSRELAELKVRKERERAGA